MPDDLQNGLKKLEFHTGDPSIIRKPWLNVNAPTFVPFSSRSPEPQRIESDYHDQLLPILDIERYNEYIDYLQDIFPQTQRATIECSFNDTGQDLSKTVAALLEIKKAEEEVSMQFEWKAWKSDIDYFYEKQGENLGLVKHASVTNQKVVTKHKSVCRYFLMGDCRIKNCQFLHSKDTVEGICTFWLHGFCARGEDCMYKHALDIAVEEKNGLKNEKIKQKTEPVVDNMQNFPCLRSKKLNPRVVSPHPSKGKWATKALPRSNKIVSPISRKSKIKVNAPKINLRLNQADTLWTPSAAPKSEVNKTVNMVTAVEIAQKLPHVEVAEIQRTLEWYPKMSDCEKVLIQRHGPPPPVKEKPTRKSAVNVRKPAGPPSFDWVNSGPTAKATYNTYRQQAEEQAKDRNTYFTLATKSFLEGDKKRARDLSHRGKACQMKMEELHKKASAEIFKERNRHLEKANKARNLLAVDLHGMHYQEAITIVQQKIEEVLNSNGRYQFLDLITGVGKHKKESGRASKALRPNIEWYLNNELGRKDLSVQEVYPGLFRVFFS